MLTDYGSMTSQELDAVCIQLLGPSLSPTVPPLIGMDVFSPKMRDMIYLVSYQHKAALELSIANALGTAAIATMGQIEVEMPTGGTIASNIGLIACAESGERKSSVQGRFKKSCLDYEAELRAIGKAAAFDKNIKRSVIMRQRKRLERQLLGLPEGTSPTTLLNQIKEISVLLDTPPPPQVSRIFMSPNITSQAFLKFFDSNAGVGAILTDEGDFTDLLKNKGLAEMVRQGLSGGSISSTRVNSDTYIPVCRFSYVCTTQYAVLKNLGRLMDQNEYGSIARLWLILAPTLKGKRNQTFFKAPVDSSCDMQWDAQIVKVLAQAKHIRETGAPWILSLDADARTHWDNFCSQIDNRIAFGEFKEASAWASKATGGVLRLAAILYFFDNPSLEQKILGRECLDRAIAIYNWLIEHAKAAYCYIFPQAGQEEAYKLLRYLLSTGITCFRSGQLINKLKSNTDKTSDWYAGLQILVDLGYVVHALPNPYDRRPGRPTKEFITAYALRDQIQMIRANLRLADQRYA